MKPVSLYGVYVSDCRDDCQEGSQENIFVDEKYKHNPARAIVAESILAL